MRLLRRGFEVFCRSAYRYYCRLEACGRQHLPAAPYILCSNHSSHIDSTALMCASGMRFDRFAMVAADDYFFQNPRMRLMPLLFKLIAAERQGGQVGRGQILRLLLACRNYQYGTPHNLIVYPEGTRSQTGEIGEFKKGVALLSIELRLPIVPAYIAGATRVMPKGSRLPRPRPVHVYFGAPLEPPVVGRDDHAGAAYGAMIDTLAERIRQLRSQHEQH